MSELSDLRRALAAVDLVIHELRPGHEDFSRAVILYELHEVRKILVAAAHPRSRPPGVHEPGNSGPGW